MPPPLTALCPPPVATHLFPPVRAAGEQARLLAGLELSDLPPAYAHLEGLYVQVIRERVPPPPPAAGCMCDCERAHAMELQAQ